MAPVTPYSAVLGDRDPLVAIQQTVERVHTLTSSWRDEEFKRSHAPGKWSARQILTHLAHAELAFGYRVRMALSKPGYVAQPFDQDAWMRREQASAGVHAAETFLVLARMNRSLYSELTDADRAVRFEHPEYGTLSVDWVIHQSAGHMLHHLKQLEQL